VGVHLENKADVVILKLRGNSFGDSKTTQMRRALRDLIADSRLAPGIDVGGVRHMNSLALSVLVSVHRNHVKRGGRVIHAHLDKSLEDLPTLTRLGRVFDAGPSLAAAPPELRVSA
jgi:anti-anti-sigma factor